MFEEYCEDCYEDTEECQCEFCEHCNGNMDYSGCSCTRCEACGSNKDADEECDCFE